MQPRPGENKEDRIKPQTYDGGGGEGILFSGFKVGLLGFEVRTAVPALGWN